MEQKILNDTINFNEALVVEPPFHFNSDTKTIPTAPHLQLLSVREVCRRLGVGRSTVYQLMSQNRLKSIHIGKRRLVYIQALEDFIIKTQQDYND